MKKENRYKSVQFLAAAALSAALIGSQIPVVFAAESRVEHASGLKMEDLFPDNITVSDPVSLSEVELPENKYGRLEWLDDSVELTERVQSCRALFIPEDDVDVSDMENWDEELGGVKGKIHVIVSSLSEEEDLEAELEDSEYIEESQDEDVTEESQDAENAPEEEESEEPEGEEPQADSEEAPDREDSSEEESSSQEEEIQAEISQEEDSASGEEENSAEDKTEGKEPEKNESQDTGSQETEEESQTAPDPEATVTPEEETSKPEEDSDNIFDAPADTEEDDRPTQLPEELTEEEKLQHGAANHTSNGITVSGINLPWYVQFRATSGESYEFSNESDAMIFKSYEFELWDLQNNTEYEIPDGEYISVTVPVKEGYDYTIEHLLDNGATETIIPSVEGSTLVFSTHSFSPFGIAGSIQLVGPDFPVEDQVKPTGTPTPTPSVTGKPGTGGGTGSNGSSGGSVSGNGTSGTGSSGTVSGGTQAGSTGNGSTGSGESNGGEAGMSAGSNQNSGNTQSGGSSTGNSLNNSQTSGSHAVATGDTTAIVPFVVLILAAAILIGAVVYIKTKKKK